MASAILDLARADAALRNAAKLWLADNIELYEGEVRLAYPSRRRSPRVTAVRQILRVVRRGAGARDGPRLPDNTELYWNQGLLDVLFEYSIRSDNSEFSINPQLERLGLRTVTSLRFLPPGGATRAYEFHGDPGLIRLDPSWHQAALRFVELGFLHILDGTDHLLFLLCLVHPVPAAAPLDPDRDRVHGRAFDHADRVSLQPGA